MEYTRADAAQSNENPETIIRRTHRVGERARDETRVNKDMVIGDGLWRFDETLWLFDGADDEDAVLFPPFIFG